MGQKRNSVSMPEIKSEVIYSCKQEKKKPQKKKRKRNVKMKKKQMPIPSSTVRAPRSFHRRKMREELRNSRRVKLEKTLPATFSFEEDKALRNSRKS